MVAFAAACNPHHDISLTFSTDHSIIWTACHTTLPAPLRKNFGELHLGTLKPAAFQCSTTPTPHVIPPTPMQMDQCIQDWGSWNGEAMLTGAAAVLLTATYA